VIKTILMAWIEERAILGVEAMAAEDAEEGEMDITLDHRGQVVEADLITKGEARTSARIESGSLTLKLLTTAGRVPEEDTQGLLEVTEMVHPQEGLQSAVELAPDHLEDP
jgi:hypothetical protein